MFNSIQFHILYLKKFLILIASSVLLFGAEKRFGTAIVASIQNTPHIVEGRNQEKKLKLHESIEFTKTTVLKTGLQDQLYLKFSNNVTIGILEDSQFRISEFFQEKFSGKSVLFSKEPSKSYFEGSLENGTLVISTKKFSPLSTFEIHLPDYIIEFHSVDCVISHQYNILHIALYKGNISLKKKNKEIIYLNSPILYTIDNYLLKNSMTGNRSSLSEAPKSWNNLINYANIENNRIVFFSSKNEEKVAAKAEIVVPMSYFNKNKYRPRSFLNPSLEQ